MIRTFDILIIILALAIFLWGILRRVQRWKIGQKDNRTDKIWSRVRFLLVEGIAHRKILQDPLPGIAHLLIFLGFLVPLMIVVLTQIMFTLPLFRARFISLALDIIGFAAILALLFAIYRRYVVRPSRLLTRKDDFVVLMLLLCILVTGFILESLRLAVIGRDLLAWAPIGNLISNLFIAMGLNVQSSSTWMMIFFRIHFALVMGTIAYIPYSKLFHMISSPLNLLFRSHAPKGALSHIDLEDETAESFGVTKIEEFTWKQLMDLDACTLCGRCQDHCPAYLTDKPLTPRNFIDDLKGHLHNRTPQDNPPLIDDIIPEDVLWACTTCRSCMEHCPVEIEHVDKIIDMRRYQVLMESKFPEELMASFRGLEKNSNPWGLGYDTRADWIGELDVPIMSEIQGEEIDLLFFVGCIRSFDDRNKKVTLAMTRILKHLGVKFAVLGMEEGCCGDPARRVGNEYLYQILAQTNIETFQRYNIKRILTTCPHCFNSFKFEYPQLGFNCEVDHHATFLQESLKNGSLELKNTLAKKLTFHDPCYLGRYSGIYGPPRDILKSIPALEIKEMARSKIDSLCCGAGGGWMWMDEKIGKRINIQRLEDALGVEPDWIATACPFCVTMFNDGIKDKDLQEDIKIWDLAELVEQALFGEQ